MTASTTRACYTSRAGRLDGWKSNREASHNRCSSQRNAARQSRAREACVTAQALRGVAPPYRVRPSSLFFWESAVRFLICVAMLAFVRGAISKFCRLVVVPVGSGAIQLRRAGLGSLVRCDLLPAARWVCSARRVRLRCSMTHVEITRRSPECSGCGWRGGHCDSMEGKNDALSASLARASNAYPAPSSSASDQAGPMKDRPSGSFCTSPIGTVRCG